MVFDEHVKRWNLSPDGEPIRTFCSDLLPVRFQGHPAMLKIARIDEERRGNRLLTWLDGHGAARVYGHADAAILMERVEGQWSLTEMAVSGQDDQATRTLCRAARVLHQPRAHAWPKLPTLRRWFRTLEQIQNQSEDLRTCWDIAQTLLDDPRDVLPLHGDIHHANVLHSSERGWLAIDPKGIIGERGFDYANLFCNPTLDFAITPGRLARQSHIAAQEAGLERERLLRWIAAYSGLSAAWFLEDDDLENAGKQVQVARIALAELPAGG